MSAPAGAPGLAMPSAPAGEPGGWTRASVRDWVDREIVPFAGEWDRAAATPPQVIRRVAEAGFLGALVPREQGGAGADWVTFAMLNEELGRGCSSIRSLLTVHSMATYAVLRWGSRAQKERWLGPLARGETIGA
ncbi:MAG TPA: acyl-CoA dehydrogenase family protein, partial [Longimicrobiaceae bacterium]|nr:acyl-CoA dehydrogenase family protein [Longimicrobiaceae bacterium]